MSKSENKALKRATVKCHGKFKTNLKVNAGKDDKDKGKEAPGQLSLLKGSGN